VLFEHISIFISRDTKTKKGLVWFGKLRISLIIFCKLDNLEIDQRTSKILFVLQNIICYNSCFEKVGSSANSPILAFLYLG